MLNSPISVDQTLVGVSYNNSFAPSLLSGEFQIDVIEFIADELIEGTFVAAPTLAKHYPILLHGVGLSLGSAEPLAFDRVERFTKTVTEWEPLWWSEHIAFTGIDGLSAGHLTPLSRNHAAVEQMGANASLVRQAAAKPFLLENIAYYFDMPGSHMAESDFIKAVLDRSGCGLLLDLNNVYCNAMNLDFDPYQFLESMPLNTIGEIHIAGATLINGMMIDTHGEPVSEDVWDMLSWVCQRTTVGAIILERDKNIPDFGSISTELERAREIATQSRSLLDRTIAQ